MLVVRPMLFGDGLARSREDVPTPVTSYIFGVQQPEHSAFRFTVADVALWPVHDFCAMQTP